VCTARSGHGAEAGQAVGGDPGARRKVLTGPVFDGFEREARNGRELDCT